VTPARSFGAYIRLERLSVDVYPLVYFSRRPDFGDHMLISTVLRSVKDYSIDPHACAYCAKCHFGCPTYEATQQEGFSARGKVQVAGGPALGRTGASGLLDSPRLLEYLDFCLRCYHCLDVCPAHIATVPIFEAIRFEVAREHPPPAYLRFLMRNVLPSRSITRNAAELGAIALQMLPFLARRVGLSAALENTIAQLPKDLRPASLQPSPGASFIAGRELPLPAGHGTRSKAMSAVLHQQLVAPPKLGRIGYFLDCLTDIHYPAAFAGTVWRLNSFGYEVVMKPDAGCCGASALNTGDEEAFKKMARAYARTFSGIGANRILFSNPTCYKTVKERYFEVLGDANGNLPEPVLDVELYNQMPPAPVHPAWRNITVAWHNPCALGFALGDKTSGANLLRKWGLNVSDAVVTEECCGYGGVFYLRYPKLAAELSAKKLRIWRDAGVDLVLTCSAGCIGHLNATAIRESIAIPTLHWGEIA
jgi:glycolate oxidase iron-sulfur subunit